MSLIHAAAAVAAAVGPGSDMREAQVVKEEVVMHGHDEDHRPYSSEWCCMAEKSILVSDRLAHAYFKANYINTFEVAFETEKSMYDSETYAVCEQATCAIATHSAKHLKPPFKQSIGSEGRGLRKVDRLVVALRNEGKQDIRVAVILQLLM